MGSESGHRDEHRPQCTPDSPDGELVNQPTRAVTAHNWDGSCYEWRHAPWLYGAVHFHDDDLEDAGWEMDSS